MSSLEHELRTHADALRRLARLLVGAQDADDLVQDVTLQALHRPPPEAAGLRAWLLGVLRHRASKQRRGELRRQHRERNAPLPDAQTTPLRVAEHKETIARLHASLMALPEPYLGTLLLRFFEELTPTAIAEQTGVPLPTVKSRLQRGLGLLRERLDAERGDWRGALASAFGFGDGVTAGAGALSAGLLMASWLKMAGVGAAVVLALAAWRWHGSDAARSVAGPSDQPRPQTVASASGAQAPRPGPALTLFASSGTERLEVPRAKPEPRPGYVRLRVVRAEDAAPMPGVEVCYFDQDDQTILVRGRQRRIDCLGDPFARLWYGGHRAVADATGEVDVPFGSATQVAAVAGDRSGFADLSGLPPADGWMLKLAHSRPLRVAVRTMDGKPAAGVPVACIHQRRNEESDVRMLGLSDAAGELTVREPTALKTLAEGPSWLGVAAPGLDSVRVALDPDAPPAEPIVLGLPATGAVELLETDHQGVPIPGESEIYVHTLSPAGRQVRESRCLVTDGSGRARIAYVGLGVRFRAASSNRTSVDVDGPKQAGETIRATLRPAADTAFVRGRLCTETGQAFALMWLEFSGEAGPTSWMGPSVCTDERGAFCICLEHMGQARELRGRLVPSGTRRHRDGRFVEFRAVLPDAACEHDVGTLQLRRSGIVMTGRLVLADGTPVDRAHLEPVLRPTPGQGTNPDGPDLVIHETDPIMVQVDVDGGFILFESEQPMPHELRVTAPDCLPDRLAVVPGARDVRVVMRRACSVAVEVLLPETIRLQRLPLRAELTGFGPIDLGNDGHGQSGPLDEGNYRLTIWLLGNTLPVAQREVAFAAGGERRHREIFDLAGVLRAAHVSVVDAAGEPVKGDGILLTGARGTQDGHAVTDAFTVHDGRAVVVSSGDSMSFDVMLSGYAFDHFTGPVADVTLRVQPQPAVLVQVEGLGELPEGCRVTFFAKDVDWLMVRADDRSGSGPGSWNWFRSDLSQGAGSFTPCRPCRLRCQLLLSRRGIELVELGEVSWAPGQGRIGLSVDADALRAALERLR